MVARLLGRLRGVFVFAAWLAAMAILPVAALAAPYAAIVIDARTGQVLYEKNADTRLHPASLTKMMTLYVAFQAIERGEITLDTKVTISKHAAGQAPSKLGLRPGQKIALRYLIRAAAIKSANDAATAIGEAISGSEAAFAKRMTRTAKAIGMSRTSFRNANGLTAEGHLSTARDMTTLGRHLFYDFPQYYNIFSRRSADAGIAQVNSTNRRFLDSYQGADGIKTGYTVAAGFNLTASAERGNTRIIATIFGGTSTAQRNAKMAELLDIGFGKAPKRATEQKPLPPVYTAEAEEAPAETVTADAVAAAIDGGVEIEDPNGGVPAGKTIRLVAAVAKSPRPPARPSAEPAPDETLIAEAAPDAAAGAPASAEDVALAAAAAAPVPGPVLVQETAPQPETLALAALPPADDALGLIDPAAQTPVTAETDVDALAAAVAVAAAEADAAAPAEAVPTEAAAAEAAPPEAALAEAAPAEAPAIDDGAATDLAVLAAVAELAGAEDEPPPPVQVARAETMRPAQRPEAVLLAAAAAAPAADPAPAQTEVAVASLLPGVASLFGTSSAEPAAPAVAEDPADALASQIVLAEAAPPAETARPLEEIFAVSTSGGRQWGITLGSYGSRYEAERQLLQTALVEMTTLEDGLRKVVGRGGGYDANFVGLTEEQADLACRRLAARSEPCEVIGPGA